MKFKTDNISGQIALAFDSKYEVLANAATLAMRETVKDAQTRARQSIRAGGPGFQSRWPNALRAKVFPERGVSAQPAGLIYIRSNYAGLFEDGGTISGSPYLWLPLKGVPKRIGFKPLTPGRLTGLVTIRRPGKPPLLGIRVRATDARFQKGISLSMLQRGTESKRGKVRVIPLFVGIPRAEIRRRWGITRAVEKAMDALPGRYASLLRDS
jgi:hypothetical protein